MDTVAFFDTKPYDREAFERLGAEREIGLKFHEFRLSTETVETAAGSRAVCVFVNDRVDAACLRRLQALGVRQVALRCAGYNNVDLKVAAELGLRVTRVPAYSPHAVAEHTLALLLTLNRRIHRAFNRVREHNFALNGLVGFDIHGKTVGIIGTGKIGRITAEIFRGFGAKVVAHDKFPDKAWAVAHGIHYAELDVVFATADILSLHVPLLPDTHHLIRAETLAKTKPGVVLLNTSRGKLVDTAALIAGLKRGHIGGVGLDVYEEEEGVFFEDLSGEVLQDDELSRLLTFPNVLVTAHQAFLTREALAEISRVTVENLVRGAAGVDALEGTELRA